MKKSTGKVIPITKSPENHPVISKRPVSELSLSELADEYSEVRQRVMAWRPNVNPNAQRFSDLAAELLKRHADDPSDQQIVVEGGRFRVPISARENDSKIIDPKALYNRLKRFGMETIIGSYSITLTNVRKLLPKAEHAKYISTERTGNRTIGEPVLKERAA